MQILVTFENKSSVPVLVKATWTYARIFALTFTDLHVLGNIIEIDMQKIDKN